VIVRLRGNYIWLLFTILIKKICLKECENATLISVLAIFAIQEKSYPNL